MDFAGLEIVPQPVSQPDVDFSSIVLTWTAEPEAGFNFTQYVLETPATLNQAWEQPSAMVLAQQFDQDILGDMGNAWNTFVQSGQIWALIIGLILGYLIRGLTVY